MDLSPPATWHQLPQSSFSSLGVIPHLCGFLHCSCTLDRPLRIGKGAILSQGERNRTDTWRRDHYTKLGNASTNDGKNNGVGGSGDDDGSLERFWNFAGTVSCQSSLGLVHLRWIAACFTFGYTNIHEICRRHFYGPSGSLLEGLVSCSPSNDMRLRSTGGMTMTTSTTSADSLPLQQLGAWSADQGIFIHPDLQFVRGVSDYRDYRLLVKDGALLPYLTPLLVVPASCLIGFARAGDEAEKQDMLKGTAIAAGVAIESDLGKGQQQQQQQQQPNNNSSSNTNGDDDKDNEDSDEQENGKSDSPEDVCKFFFDSLSLLANDCLVASNNSNTDSRHNFASVLLSGTRTLKNAPYLSDRDFAVVGGSCPIAEAFRRMVQSFVDNGPLTGKVERPLLQSAVSLSLSHSLVLPMNITRHVDNHGKIIRGNCGEKIEASSGGIGVIPWIHMLPHGGATLNAVPVAVSAEDAFSFSHWVALQVPASGLASAHSQKIMKNGFVALVACEDIVGGEEVCSQIMAPLNPVRIAGGESSNKKEKKGQQVSAKTSEQDREQLLAEQYEIDKEYDETLAMWMVTTASAPPAEAVPSAEAKFVQSCIYDAVTHEVEKMLQDEKQRGRSGK